MSQTAKKEKLNTAIEKELHEHMINVMEGTVDAVVLTVRRNNVQLDRETMTYVLELFRKLMPGEHLSKLDTFLIKLDKRLEDFSKE
jgi:type III secretory pathway lipoprotein EscJ